MNHSGLGSIKCIKEQFSSILQFDNVYILVEIFPFSLEILNIAKVSFLEMLCLIFQENRSRDMKFEAVTKRANFILVFNLNQHVLHEIISNRLLVYVLTLFYWRKKSQNWESSTDIEI